MPFPSLFRIFAFKCLVKSTRLLREGKHSLLFLPFNLNKEETTLFSTALLINNNEDLQLFYHGNLKLLYTMLGSLLAMLPFLSSLENQNNHVHSLTFIYFLFLHGKSRWMGTIYLVIYHLYLNTQNDTSCITYCFKSFERDKSMGLASNELWGCNQILSQVLQYDLI